MSTRSSAVSALLALLLGGACGSDASESTADGPAEASTAAAGGMAPSAGADATRNTGGTGSGGAAQGATVGSIDGGPGATDGRAGALGAGGSRRDGGRDASVGGEDGGGGSDASVDGEALDAPDDSADANSLSWISNLFPASRPATITVTATIQENDIECVIVYGGGQCQALYNPPCIPSSRQRTVTLDLTLDENGNLTVEAPYQEMCAPDYFCAVSGPTCPIPTSYAVPTDTTFYFAPRPTDYCRRHENGTPYPVENVVSVQLSGTTLVIDQLCTTHMRNLTSEVIDIRDWTTTIVLR